MKKTLSYMLESELKPEVDKYEQNKNIFVNLESLTEEQSKLTNYVPQKVMVLKESNETDTCLIEFSNNLERLMNDENVSLDEAVEMVAECNEISKSDIVVVFDESCLLKYDLETLTSDTEIKMVKK